MTESMSSARAPEQTAPEQTTPEQTARELLQIAEQRDAAAHLRDLSAIARDQAADARDRTMAQLDAAASEHERTRLLTGVELVASAAAQRRRAARYRAQAAEHRLLSARDRRAAAQDRQLAAEERRQALHDREVIAAELDRAAVDGLTGARTRAAGLGELEHELDRARRTGSSLVVAFLDVVGLKTVNDGYGHSAGDAMLRNVVAGIKAHVRPYDLVIRVGGDEFVCVMSNLTEEDARARFGAIALTIQQAPQPSEIRVGFARLSSDGETAEELLARADSELIRSLPAPRRAAGSAIRLA
jgi:diguanylate cyclase (GGDEF)-like protein